MLSANNPALFGPYPPVPRQSFIKLEARLGNRLLQAMVDNANLSPRPLDTNGSTITVDAVEQELERRNLPRDVVGIFLALCHVGARLSGRGGARVLCKSPDNLKIAEQFKGCFEQTSFLHLTRDPRAVWNSARGTPRGTQTPRASALEWADYHSRVLKLAEQIPIITLKYEDLMLHPKLELERACQFLHIPFSEEMLEDHGSSQAKKAALVNPALWGNLAKPVLYDRAGAWKTELPQSEIDIIENSCAPVMKAFGYKPMFPARSLSEAEMNFKPEIGASATVEEPREEQILHILKLQQLGD